MDNCILDLKILKKSYFIKNQEYTILQDVNFRVEKSKLIGLIGDSGSGKTTFLQILGLVDSCDGSMNFKGNDINLNKKNLQSKTVLDIRKKIGTIYQYHNLLNELTVFENIALSAKIAGKYDKHTKQEIENNLELLGLKNTQQLYPDSLSGGQLQRVSIARALIKKPDLILADEPTGSLDFANSQTVFDLISNIPKNYDTSVIFVTHNQNFIKKFDICYKINNGSIDIL